MITTGHEATFLRRFRNRIKLFTRYSCSSHRISDLQAGYCLRQRRHLRHHLRRHPRQQSPPATPKSSTHHTFSLPLPVRPATHLCERRPASPHYLAATTTIVEVVVVAGGPYHWIRFQLFFFFLSCEV
ncbi:unnamed protein product [Lactuca virosa]|uniref:Uncharacterized protein n=1 Tax=Lactuca virosa TaxID=75947 RepID=A0AAU9LT36_9ASTR|nr:unnamed protein product [Lactuca virosa]